MESVDAQSKLAVREYQRLHEGLKAREVVQQDVSRPVGRRTLLGHVEQIQYLKSVTNGVFDYWHPHEDHAQPELWRDSRGKLFVRGRNYVVTDRGIEDMPRGKFTRRAENYSPKRLVTLGTLEWIRYRSLDGTSQILRFEGAARPVLAHDETGKLHVLNGRYKIEVDPMARRRRHSKRHSAPRANPSGRSSGSAMMKHAEKYGTALLATGAGVFVGAQVLTYLANMSWFRITNPYAKAAAVGVLGLGAGLAAFMYAPSKAAPTIGTALGAGGVALALNNAWLTYRASRGMAGVFQLPAARRAAPVNAFAGRRVA